MWRDPPSRRDPLGSYYLLVSGLSGWRPNAALLYRASPPLERSTWQRLGNPARNGHTFYSQPTAVLPFPYHPATTTTTTITPGHAYAYARTKSPAHRPPSLHAVGGDASPQPRLLLYLGDRWNMQGPGSVGNASYVWLPMLRGQPGQRGCRNSSSRLGACVPGAWGYVIPRLPGSGHAMRWQPRQFMGTGVQGVQGEVGERHERPTAAAKAVAAPSLRRRDARRGAARHSRRTHSAPAPPAPPAPLAPPALQGCSARGSCGRVGATPHPAAPWPHRHAYRHR